MGGLKDALVQRLEEYEAIINTIAAVDGRPPTETKIIPLPEGEKLGATIVKRANAECTVIRLTDDLSRLQVGDTIIALDGTILTDKSLGQITSLLSQAFNRRRVLEVRRVYKTRSN